MLLNPKNGELFTTGAAPYTYKPVSAGEKSNRIILSLKIEDIETLGFVDTGGVYAIVSPEIADQLNRNSEDCIQSIRLKWGRGDIQGTLDRVRLTLLAEEGESLSIEVTAFIPQNKLNEEWPEDFPCILGLTGCLEFIRFAVDPSTDTFYFGEPIKPE
jgi:hypothetical protein